MRQALLLLLCPFIACAQTATDLNSQLHQILEHWTNATAQTNLVMDSNTRRPAESYSWPSISAQQDNFQKSLLVPADVTIPSYAFEPVDQRLIPAGPFLMITKFFDIDRGSYHVPPRTVNVHAVYMDMFEVSTLTWRMVREWGLRAGYTDLPEGQMGAPLHGHTDSNHPIVMVSWYDCVKWCNARSEMDGLPPVYYTDSTQISVYRTGLVNLTSLNVDWKGRGYRLPTEAEWEKASRGTLVGKSYPWGDEIKPENANYSHSNDPYDDGTTPVGYYNGHQDIPGAVSRMDMYNAYGLYDMAGNVYEWCWDRFAPPNPADLDNPKGPDEGLQRCVRGGSWKSMFTYCLACAFRYYNKPDFKSDFIGFRCVRNL